MCAGNRLQFKTVLVDGFDDFVRIVARIDADRAPGFLAAHHARVLLESGDGDFFDDH